MTIACKEETRGSRIGLRGRRAGAIVTAGVAVVALLAACGSSSGRSATATTGVASAAAGIAAGVVPGVTATTITLSVVGAYSGPLAAIFDQQYKAAALTWRDEVNANGGINGRQVVLKKVDDGGSVQGAVAACKAIESNGSFAAFTQSAIQEEVSCLDGAGIPTFDLDASGPNPQTAFKNVRSVTSIVAESVAMAQFVSGPKGLDRAGHKIGVLYLSDFPYQTQSGLQFISDAKAIHLDIQSQTITTNQPSFTAELQRFKDAGVDTLVVFAVAESIGILRDANALSYRPIITTASFDADELTAAGAQPFEGIKGIRYWTTTDTAAFQNFQQKVAQYHETTNPTTTNGVSYGGLLIMQKALELAGRSLTRASYLAAFDQIQNFDVGTLAPVTYGPGRSIGADAFFPVECCNPNNTWKSLGPAQATF
jgi:branched-chain amino acid transport system substrate-binding protein